MRLVQFNGQIKKIGDNLYTPDALPISDEFEFPTITDKNRIAAFAASVDGTSYQFFFDGDYLPDDVKMQLKDNAMDEIYHIFMAKVPEWLIDHVTYFFEVCVTPKGKGILSLRLGCELYAIPDFENHAIENDDDEIIIEALKQNKDDGYEWENITNSFAAYSAIDVSFDEQSELIKLFTLIETKPKCYYHATTPENADKIYADKLIKSGGMDNCVYLCDTPEDACKFLLVRGEKRIAVLEIDAKRLESFKLFESDDHNADFFKCNAYEYDGDIPSDWVTRKLTYDYN